MRNTRILLVGVILLALFGTGLALVKAREKSSYRVTLTDGSTFTLKEVAVSATNFSYSHQQLGRGWDVIAPILPEFLVRRISRGGSSFGMGGEGTNLFVITVLRFAPGTTPAGIQRLRISDGTNFYDACWGANTIGTMNETVNGWQVRAFPRRSPHLVLEFLSQDPTDNPWSVAARFQIPNPLYGQFPQWTPGSRLQTNGNLTVRLARFQSGVPALETERGALAPAATEMLFEFEEDGKSDSAWRVQKVTLSDATGNEWFPYLDLVKQGSAWAHGGEVHFIGGLWPGEAAWKIDAELVRTGGLPSADLFTLEVPLPAPATVTTLTNEWEHEGATVKFASLASPNVDHPGHLIWTGKWWGENKHEVYSLVLELQNGKNQRLQLVNAADNHENKVELLEYRGQNYVAQGLFFRPGANATKLRLTFSLTHSRFVQFLARPDFPIGGEIAKPGKNGLSESSR